MAAGREFSVQRIISTTPFVRSAVPEPARARVRRSGGPESGRDGWEGPPLHDERQRSVRAPSQVRWAG